jgi:hypothetical protein
MLCRQYSGKNQMPWGSTPRHLIIAMMFFQGGRDEKDYTPSSGSRTSSTGTLLRRSTLRLTLPMMASPSRPCG